MDKRIQAKHVDEAQLLDRVKQCMKPIGASFWDIADGFQLPKKVVRAKLCALVRRKVLSGCPEAHNCRGDYIL